MPLLFTSRASKLRLTTQRRIWLIEGLEPRQLLSAVPAVVKPILTRAHGAVFQATEGASFAGADVATFTADPAGTYSATIDWGDKSGVVNGTVVAGASGSYTVVGGHDYAKFGRYPITVKIINSSNKTVTAFSSAKVADAALTASPIFISATRNVAFSGNVATFTDADPNAIAMPKPTETATINWGDGTSSLGTISQAAPGGPFTVSGKHMYGVAKTFTVIITVHDPGGAKATATSGAVVSPPAPVTTPSLIGDYKGSVKIGGLIGSLTGSHSFEIDITAQDVNGITGKVLFSGGEIASGTFPANGVGELSNGNFEFSQTDGSVSITISGHISPDSSRITSGFVKGSGLPIVGSLHGTFTLTKQ